MLLCFNITLQMLHFPLHILFLITLPRPHPLGVHFLGLKKESKSGRRHGTRRQLIPVHLSYVIVFLYQSDQSEIMMNIGKKIVDTIPRSIFQTMQ